MTTASPGSVTSNLAGRWRRLGHTWLRNVATIIKRWQGRAASQPVTTVDLARRPSTSSRLLVPSAEEKDRLIDAVRAYPAPLSAHRSSEDLVQVVELLAAGHGVRDVAGRLGVARCTVHRWINLVRKLQDERGSSTRRIESAP